MSELVTYALEDGIATIRLDDGKRNALSMEMFGQISAALDRATADRAAVVLSGREGTFSAGFDLRALGSGGAAGFELVRTGFELAERILAFPSPVVMACSGHAIAMGIFLVLAGDYRVGTAGPYRIGANEVAIGLTMPFFAIEICRQRLAPAHFHRAVITAEMYTPEDAVVAGFLDRVVAAEELQDAARSKAMELAKLDASTFAATKLRARDQSLKAIRKAIEADGETFNAVLRRSA